MNFLFNAGIASKINSQHENFNSAVRRIQGRVSRRFCEKVAQNVDQTLLYNCFCEKKLQKNCSDDVILKEKKMPNLATLVRGRIFYKDFANCRLKMKKTRLKKK
jgi:hypothetical protein